MVEYALNGYEECPHTSIASNRQKTSAPKPKTDDGKLLSVNRRESHIEWNWAAVFEGFNLLFKIANRGSLWLTQ